MAPHIECSDNGACQCRHTFELFDTTRYEVKNQIVLRHHDNYAAWLVQLEYHSRMRGIWYLINPNGPDETNPLFEDHFELPTPEKLMARRDAEKEAARAYAVAQQKKRSRRNCWSLLCSFFPFASQTYEEIPPIQKTTSSEIQSELESLKDLYEMHWMWACDKSGEYDSIHCWIQKTVRRDVLERVFAMNVEQGRCTIQQTVRNLALKEIYKNDLEN